MALAFDTATASTDTAVLAVQYELQRLARLADQGRPHRLLLLTADAVVEGVTISLIRYLRTLSADTAELEVDLERGGPLVDHQYLYLQDAHIVSAGEAISRPVHKVRVLDVTHMNVLQLRDLTEDLIVALL